MDERKLLKTVDVVGNLLVSRQYEALASLTHNRRLTADELRDAVEDYGRLLVLPPSRDWSLRSVIQLEPRERLSWSLYVDLWTEEEGRSDLTMELVVHEASGDLYEVEVENIHVL